MQRQEAHIRYCSVSNMLVRL